MIPQWLLAIGAFDLFIAQAVLWVFVGIVLGAEKEEHDIVPVILVALLCDMLLLIALGTAWGAIPQ